MRWSEMVSGGVPLGSLAWLALALAAPGLARADEPPKPLPPPVVRRLKGPAAPVPAGLQPPPQAPAPPAAVVAPLAAQPAPLPPQPVQPPATPHTVKPPEPPTTGKESPRPDPQAILDALAVLGAALRGPPSAASAPTQLGLTSDELFRANVTANTRMRARPRHRLRGETEEQYRIRMAAVDRVERGEDGDRRLGALRSSAAAVRGDEIERYQVAADFQPAGELTSRALPAQAPLGHETPGEVEVLRRWQASPSFDERRSLLEVRRDPTRLGTQGDAADLDLASAVEEVERTTPKLMATTLPAASLGQRAPEVLRTPSSWEGVFSLERLQATPQVTLGGATTTATRLKALQAGAFDPTAKGFAKRTLSMGAGVKVYAVDLDALVTVTDDEAAQFTDGGGKVALEEGTLWRDFVAGRGRERWSARAMKFYTPFGIENLRPSYDQWWVDEPLCVSRLLGARGLISDLGGELTWANHTTRVQVGAQNADEGSMDPFLSNGENSGFKEGRLGGRPFQAERDGFLERVVLFAHVDHTFRPRDARQWTWRLGASAVVGPNGTGPDGDTQVYGADLHGQGTWNLWGARRLVLVQGEAICRRFGTDDVQRPDGTTLLASDQLTDYGAYLEGLLTLSEDWAVGLRADYLSGKGDSVTRIDDVTYNPLPRNSDPYRDDRLRLSPLLIWKPVSSLRIRLEYSYDDASHLGDAAHIVWMSFDGTWGFEKEAPK